MELENPTSLSLKALSIPLPRTRMWRGGVSGVILRSRWPGEESVCSFPRLVDVAWDSAKSLRIVERRGRCIVVR